MKKRSKIRKSLAFLVVLCSLVAGSLPAQRKSFEKKVSSPGAMIKDSDVDYQLWEGFQLVRRANAGEPAAQHELGLRYLQGKGFEADTFKAAFWLGKSSDQGFDLANYNLGILTMNGWGTTWNPFQAFRLFHRAAEKSLPESQFVEGLILTENLVVPQDWARAYRLIKKAAAAGFEPAKKALVEFQRRGISDTTKAEESSKAGASARPIFLDFNVDTTSHVDEQVLLNELAHEAGPQLKKALGVTDEHETAAIRDTSAMSLIRRAAEAGSPEALALLGRLYEKGIGLEKDIIRASMFYTRAIRLESIRARGLLFTLAQEPGYMENLEAKSKAHDARAAFVWSGLVAARFDQRLSGDQALALLQGASNQKEVDAVIELGLCYQTGRWVDQDRAKAMELWKIAETLKSREAAIRVAIAKMLQGATQDEIRQTVHLLEEEAGEGSLLAEVALAYCYESGTGMPQNKGEAARLYRNASQRGSQSAYEALRRMHDAIRPAGKEYQISF